MLHNVLACHTFASRRCVLLQPHHHSIPFHSINFNPPKLIVNSALDDSLLSMAIQRSRIDCAATLLKYGACIDMQVPALELAADEQPLQVAVCVGAPGSLIRNMISNCKAEIAKVTSIKDQVSAHAPALVPSCLVLSCPVLSCDLICIADMHIFVSKRNGTVR